MLPVVPAVALIPALVLERIPKNALRAVAAAVSAGVIAICGAFVYQHPLTTFARAGNPDKLPDGVVRVAECLLSLEEEPRVVPDHWLSPYLRQYSGKIRTMYGRDVIFGGAETEVAREVHEALSGEEWNLELVARRMDEHGYRYLAVWNEDRDETIQKAGFALIQQIDGYGIYRRAEAGG